MTWSTFPSAVRVLLALRHPGGRPGERRRTVERSGSPIDVYEPDGGARGTIVFIHGMAEAGYRDPRIVDLALALGAAGLRVVVPDIVSIRELKIRRRQAREVLELLQAIAVDAELVPGGRFALMAVSFSGVFAIRAACRDGLAAPLDGLCLIGVYSDLGELCRFLVHSPRADSYALLLIARSYYTEVEPESPGFLKALDRCIAAKIEHGEDWDLSRELDAGDPDQARMAALLNDASRRSAFAEGLRRAFEGEWGDYRVPLDFARHDLPVLLIHGRSDRVIPAEESRRLGRHLAAQGIPHRVCITDILTHGDSRLHLRLLWEIGLLARDLAWFFGAIGGRGATGRRADQAERPVRSRARPEM